MTLAEMQRQLADNDRKIAQLIALNKMQSRADANLGDFDNVRSKADAALMQHGRRAGQPLLGEPVMAYRRRLAGQLKEYSPRWKDLPLEAVRADAFEAQIEAQIYQDAAIAAKNPVVPEGELRCIPGETYSGAKMNTYFGSPSAWMNPLAGPVKQFVSKFLTGEA